MDSNLFKTKSIEQLVRDVEQGDRTLRRTLSAWDLTLLGIGGIIGTGIEGPEVAPPKSDRETAFQLGRRVAEAARRWNHSAAALQSIAR